MDDDDAGGGGGGGSGVDVVDVVVHVFCEDGLMGGGGGGGCGVCGGGCEGRIGGKWW